MHLSLYLNLFDEFEQYYIFSNVWELKYSVSKVETY